MSSWARLSKSARRPREISAIDPGDIVSAESHIIDDTCYQCRVGDRHVCATAQIIGISLDGCFSELVKLPAKTLWPTDIRKIRPEVAALQEPFGNAVHACTKVNLRGQSVAIIGLGTIGLFAVAVARALGARAIIGIEPEERNRRMALALGADAVIAPSQPTAQSYIHDAAITQEIHDLTDGVGVDVAIEMSGATASLNTAIAGARRGGNVIMFGLKSGDAVIEHVDRVIVDGISLHSVVGRRIWETWHITRNILESRDPNIHDAVFDVILDGGRDCIVQRGRLRPGDIRAPHRFPPQGPYPLVVTEDGDMHQDAYDVFDAQLAEIREAGLWKEERVISSPQGAYIEVDGRQVLNLCANNYLGLSSNPEVIAAAKEALDRRGFGMSSVRFICGTQDIHRELETEICALLRVRRRRAVRLLLRRQRRPLRDPAQRDRRRHQRLAQPRVHHRRHPALQGPPPPLCER